jgi:hypothetical protein
MKKVFLLFYLVTSCLLYGQKKYHFDYMFSVKESYKLNKTNFNSVFLVNSKNNSFNLYAHENEDALKFIMHFTDQKGVRFNSQLPKIDFYKAKIISNTCNEVVRFNNPFKEKGKEYNFINYSDTIINDTSYFHYAIKSNKKLRYQKRKKIVTTHFIVEKSNPNFLPFTYIPTIYETWKISKVIPNGIPKTIYFINTKGEQTGKMEIKAVQIDKYATIPVECDYSNPNILIDKLVDRK